MRMIAWYVAAGGAIGSVARFLLGAAIQSRMTIEFPVGTLVINVTGSLLLGFLFRLALGTPEISPEIRAFLTTGFCGGYTTFSTFTFETANLLEAGQIARAATYVGLSILVGLTGTFAGFAVAHYALAAGRAR
jgi:fluoride exporter